jgi:hypothetical protein
MDTKSESYAYGSNAGPKAAPGDQASKRAHSTKISRGRRATTSDIHPRRTCPQGIPGVLSSRPQVRVLLGELFARGTSSCGELGPGTSASEDLVPSSPSTPLLLLPGRGSRLGTLRVA